MSQTWFFLVIAITGFPDKKKKKNSNSEFCPGEVLWIQTVKQILRFYSWYGLKEKKKFEQIVSDT